MTQSSHKTRFQKTFLHILRARIIPAKEKLTSNFPLSLLSSTHFLKRRIALEKSRYGRVRKENFSNKTLEQVCNREQPVPTIQSKDKHLE